MWLNMAILSGARRCRETSALPWLTLCWFCWNAFLLECPAIQASTPIGVLVLNLFSMRPSAQGRALQTTNRRSNTFATSASSPGLLVTRSQSLKQRSPCT
jgi:hypothetical protein